MRVFSSGRGSGHRAWLPDWAAAPMQAGRATSTATFRPRSRLHRKALSRNAAAPTNRAPLVAPATTARRPPRAPAPLAAARASRGGSLSGLASYYWQPQRVASGGWFNPNALTAAHKTPAVRHPRSRHQPAQRPFGCRAHQRPRTLHTRPHHRPFEARRPGCRHDRAPASCRCASRSSDSHGLARTGKCQGRMRTSGPCRSRGPDVRIRPLLISSVFDFSRPVLAIPSNRTTADLKSKSSNDLPNIRPQ